MNLSLWHSRVAYYKTTLQREMVYAWTVAMELDKATDWGATFMVHGFAKTEASCARDIALLLNWSDVQASLLHDARETRNKKKADYPSAADYPFVRRIPHSTSEDVRSSYEVDPDVFELKHLSNLGLFSVYNLEIKVEILFRRRYHWSVAFKRHDVCGKTIHFVPHTNAVAQGTTDDEEGCIGAVVYALRDVIIDVYGTKEAWEKAEGKRHTPFYWDISKYPYLQRHRLQTAKSAEIGCIGCQISQDVPITMAMLEEMVPLLRECHVLIAVRDTETGKSFGPDDDECQRKYSLSAAEVTENARLVEIEEEAIDKRKKRRKRL